MDFQQLLAKMNELSQPASASTAVAEQPVAECPPAMGPMGGEMGGMDKPDTPPPSISVNLNAQGLDNIEQLLDLIKAVNPDAVSQAPSAAPVIDIEPMDKPAGLPSLGNLDAGPLKMLPDLDSEEPAAGPMGGDIDPIGGDDVSKSHGDLDNDGDHDMDDHNMEPDSDTNDQGGDKKEKDEAAYGNSLGDSEPETMDTDAAVPNGNDLNREKQQFRRAQPGDNPMAMEGEELRAWIKSELTQRLAEAKGAK